MAFTTAEPWPAQQLDILETFGPLAAMHAVLERQGIGLPCSSAAFFPTRRAQELDQAIGHVARGLPVLRSRLAWQGDHPLLEMQAAGPTRLQDPLAFRPDEAGVWGYRLSEQDGGVWLSAAFAHAVADGPSMLRFMSAVGGALTGQEPPAYVRSPRPAPQRRAMAAWLPGFVIEHAVRYDGLPPQNRSPGLGASFLTLPSLAAKRLQEDAGKAGVTARLAAATAAGFLDQQRGSAEGRVHLNVPISRGAADLPGGFGFDGSSVRLPLRLSRGVGLDALAARVGEGLRGRIDQGWDLNLLRFLGGSPSRRMRFARTQAARPPDPCLTISWKGRREHLGPTHGIGQVACFGAAPTLHLSAHIDDGGLSLSLTTPQNREARQALLCGIIDRLDLGRPQAVRELSDVAS